MKQLFSLLGLLALYQISIAQQTTWFEDDFSSSEKFKKTWEPLSGVWKVADGKVITDTKEYDQGIAASIFLFKDKRFSIEAKLKGSRAGLYFSLDDISTKANSQMVRFEDRSLLWGYFNAAGEYNATGMMEMKVSSKFKPGADQWNTLRIDVDPTNRQYKIFVNNDSVGFDDQLMFASGYIGLQASDGHAEFDYIKVTGFGKLSSTAEYKIKPQLQIDHLSAIGTVDGQIIAVNRIVGLAQLIDETGRLRNQYGPLIEPFIGGVVVSPKKEIYVANQTIKVWDSNGKYLESFGEKVLKAPVAVAVDDADRAYVIDNHEVKVFDGGRQWRHEKSVGQFITTSSDTIVLKDPKNLSVKGDLLYVADAGRHEVLVISTKDFRCVNRFRDRLSAPWDVKVDAYGTAFVADAGNRGIMKFDARGDFQDAFYARSLGGLIAPRGVAINGDELLVADMERIVVTDTSLADVKPTVVFKNPVEAEIKWRSPVEDFGSIEYSPRDWQEKNLLAAGGKGFEHSIRITDLKPLTRYVYRIRPCLRTIPEDASFSRTYRFATPPAEKGTRAFASLRNLILVYRNVTYRDMYPEGKYPDIPSPRRLTDDDLDYLRRCAQFNREFYFRNSSCKLNLDFDIYVVEDALGLREISRGNHPGPYWLEPTERVADDVKKAAASLSRKPEDYVGVIAIYSWVNYPPRGKTSSDTIKIQQAVGGGTNTIPAPWRYGKTTGYTGIPFPDRASRQDWLITHEYHHQLDVLFDLSGYPGYCHSDLPWKMPGRFGEDFDFNAKIMRMATKELGEDCWLNVKFGELKATKDNDGDGVPDDDPFLPFDEKRLHGSPSSKDTDNDGLTDLQEVMAGNAVGAVLDDPDTDGDGLVDGIDPEPLYAVKPERPKLTAKLDGTLEKGWSYFATVKDSQVQGKTYFNWDENNLYFAYRLNQPADFRIQIDANNDGWFHGSDNLLIQISFAGDAPKAAEYYLMDASSWAEVPRIVRGSVVKPEDIVMKWSSEKSPYIVEVAIPRNEKVGLTLAPQKKLSVRVAVKLRDRWDWIELFERNYMMECRLVEIAEAKRNEEIRTFLDNIEQEYEATHKRWAEANWRYVLETTNSVYQRDVVEREKQLRDMFRKSNVFEQMQGYQAVTSDTQLQRRLQLLFPLFYYSTGIPKTLDDKIIELTASINTQWSAHHAYWTDKEGTLTGKQGGKVLLKGDVTGYLERLEDVDDRESLYLQSISVEKVLKTAGFKELIKLRNEAAHQITIGDHTFENYYSLQLYLQGFDENQLLKTYESILAATELAQNNLVGKAIEEFGKKALLPYNLPYYLKPLDPQRVGQAEIDAYFAKDKMLPWAKETVKDIGLDLGKEPLSTIILDLESRIGKYPDVCTVPVELPEDVRLSALLTRGSQQDELALLSGIGCSIHYASVRWSVPKAHSMLLEPVLVEATATFLGELIFDPEWYARYTTMPPEMAKATLLRYRDDRVMRLRTMIVAALFEREIYRNPDADYDEVWWNLAEKHLKLSRVQDDNGGLVSAWGTIPQLVNDPVRLQNSVLAAMVAAQVRAYLRKQNQSIVANPKTGQFLIERFYQQGAAVPWDQIVQVATGEPLTSKYLVER